MHRPTDDWHTGPAQQITPAPPGWLLAVLIPGSDDRLSVCLYPIMCWAHVLTSDAGDNMTLPVIEVLDGSGQPYIGECASIAPGQSIRAIIECGLGVAPGDYTLDTCLWQPDFLRQYGWQPEQA